MFGVSSDIVHNLSLLLALGLLYFLLPFRLTMGRWYQRVIAGCIIGLIGIGVMGASWHMTAGIFFDVRTILLAVTSLFFGVIPTAVAGLIMVAFRIWVGGAGTATGIATIITSAGIGLLWRHFRPHVPRSATWGELLLFGFTVHVVMLLCMLLMPSWPQAWDALLAISLPTLSLYPLATFLLVMLLNRHAERQAFQVALTASEARYRSLFESNHAIMLLIDPHTGAIIDANGAAAAFYGWPREALLGMRMDRLNTLPPEMIIAEMEQARTEQRDRFLFRHRCADGEIRDVEVFSGPIHVDGRELLYSIVHDVTDRRVMEEALATKTAQLDRYFSQALDLLCIVDVDGHFVQINKEWEHALGYPLEALQGKSILALVHPDDMAPTREALSDLRAQTPVTNFVNRYRHQDGSYRWIEWRSFPEGDMIYACARDITKRKQAEEALQQANELLQAIISASPVAIRVMDVNRTIQVWNPAAEHLFGWQAEEVLHRPLPSAFYEVDPEYQQNVQRAFEGMTVVHRETLRRHKDGRFINVRMSEAPVRSGTGEIIGSVAFLGDITADKRAEQDLLQQKNRAEVLARIASQLNAELNLDAVMQIICDGAARALAVPAACVMLYDEMQDYLHLAAGNAEAPDALLLRALPVSRTSFEHFLARYGDPISLLDIEQAKHDMVNAGLYTRLGLRTMVSMPLWRDGQLIGTLNIYTQGATQEFTPDDLSLLQSLGDLAAQAIASSRAYEDAQRRLAFTQALRDIDRAITASLDLRVILQVFIGQVISQLGVDASAVLLFDPTRRVLEYAEGQGFRTRALRHTRLRLGEGYAGEAALQRRIVFNDNLQAEMNGLKASPLLNREGFVAYVAVPIIAKGQVKGVLELFHRSALRPAQEWWDYCDALASQAAIAIENATLFEELREANDELVMAYDTTLEGLSRALDLRDKETEGHSLRVTAMAERLAKAMGVTGDELVNFRRGALLHDIGKLGVPDGILLKPGPLSAEEWMVMRQHPVNAYQLLSTIPFLRNALDIPFCHHEKWDGSGYPRGLCGEEIPLAARIFAVVDVWDALITERVYREKWPEPAVIDYLRAQVGKHFDPAVVDTFLRMVTDPGGVEEDELIRI